MPVTVTFDFGAGLNTWPPDANWTNDVKPATGDDVVFDNTSDEDCLATEAIPTLTSFTVAAAYGGNIDLATYSVTAPTVMLDGTGIFDMGSGTMTVSNFDNKDQGTFDDGTSTLVFSGDGEWISKEGNWRLYNVTINAGVTTTVPASSGVCYVDNLLAINGELAFAWGEMVSSCGTTTVGVGGSVTGLGGLEINNPGAGQGLTVQDGTITCAILYWFQGDVDAILAPGTYAPITRFDLESTGGAGTLRLSAGTYNFNCAIQLGTVGAGVETFDCSTNSPTVNVTGNVTIDQAGGTAAWTGPINLTGGSNQNVTMDGVASQPSLIINKSGGTVTFLDGWSGGSFLGTAGRFDPNGRILETSGNFTILAGATIANPAGSTFSVGGNLDWRGTSGAPLDLDGSAPWTLNVSGSAAIRFAVIANCDASGGTTIKAWDSIDAGGNTNIEFVTCGHHADALRLEISSVEIRQLTAVGTIPGVVILLAAARNGRGTGRLRSTGYGTDLSWRAPGSSTFGVPIDCSADGTYILEDGQDADKYIRVQVYADYLTPIESRVYLDDRYDNGSVDDDVTAGEAAAGDVANYTITLTNAGTFMLSHLKVWLESPSEDLEISENNVDWVSPTSEAGALEFPDLPAAGSDLLYLRRTITAGAVSDPAVLNYLHFAFDGL